MDGRWGDVEVRWSFREEPVEFSRSAHEALSILHYITWARDPAAWAWARVESCSVGTFPGRSRRRCRTDLGGISPTHQKVTGTEKPWGAQIAFCAAPVSHLLFLTVSWKHLGKAIWKRKNVNIMVSRISAPVQVQKSAFQWKLWGAPSSKDSRAVERQLYTLLFSLSVSPYWWQPS